MKQQQQQCTICRETKPADLQHFPAQKNSRLLAKICRACARPESEKTEKQRRKFSLPGL